VIVPGTLIVSGIDWDLNRFESDPDDFRGGFEQFKNSSSRLLVGIRDASRVLSHTHFRHVGRNNSRRQGRAHIRASYVHHDGYLRLRAGSRALPFPVSIVDAARVPGGGRDGATLASCVPLLFSGSARVLGDENISSADCSSDSWPLFKFLQALALGGVEGGGVNVQLLECART